MVDLGGGQDGPIEHGFSNTVFILPGFIFVSLTGVQDAVQQNDGENVPPSLGDGNFNMPTLEQLADLIGGSNMTEDEKNDLLENLMKVQNPNASGVPQSGQFLYLIIPLTILIFIFVFFGYKLYKSVVDKERKRDEKRKQKQQKKKK